MANRDGFRGENDTHLQNPYVNQKGVQHNGGEGSKATKPGVYIEDTDLTLYNGDALEVLKTLPDGSVHMCVTSPPFYGLRDYGTGSWVGGDEDCDHTPPKQPGRSFENGQGESYTTNNQNWSKRDETTFGQTCGKCGASRVDQQIGLEETPEQWVEKLVGVFREVRRVLRADGTCWVEVGDSYASAPVGSFNGGGFKDKSAETGGRDLSGVATSGSFNKAKASGCKPKDLIGAPWMLAFALRADGWYLRSDIVWSRPNPMPESVTDRPTKSHSYVFLLSKNSRYFFDQEAVRETQHPDGRHKTQRDYGETNGAHDNHQGMNERERWSGAGRNVRSVWQIATQPYPEAHFATYPEELVRRCILAGSSERGCCPECGAPWFRLLEYTEEPKNTGVNIGGGRTRHNEGLGITRQAPTRPEVRAGEPTPKRDLGWRSACLCDAGPLQHVTYSGHRAHIPIPCTVLDPFFGSGTTGLVARKHGRRTIGIELSSSYCELAARRLQQLSLLAEGV